MEINWTEIISYIVVGLTSLSTVLAWVASCIKSLAANKRASELIEEVKEEVKETKSYKELKGLVTEIISQNKELLQDNALLKEQLNETMAELTRVKKDYRRENTSK